MESLSYGRYSYHWSNKGVRDYVLRHDNAPHEKWKTVSTFPKHCYEGSESNVVSSKIPDDSSGALKYLAVYPFDFIIFFMFMVNYIIVDHAGLPLCQDDPAHQLHKHTVDTLIS